MDLRNSFEVLSTVLERYESGGRAVRRIETESIAGAGLRATMDIAVPLETAADDDATATLTDDGSLRVECSGAGLPSCPESVTPAVTTTTSDVRATDDGAVVVSVTLSIDRAGAGDDPAGGDLRPDGSRSPGTDVAGVAGSGPGQSAESADLLAEARDESVPPYEDAPYLRALYEGCDTFAEMSREIEMDVSSETVRRYMIEAGIHDPTTYNRVSEDGDDAEDDEGEPAAATARTGDGSGSPAEDPMKTIPNEQLITDGIGLPADLTIEDIADAVVGSSTTYQVHRRLGIEQDEARELLRELNLIDLVLHRIGGRPEDEPSYEEVASRIRQCTLEETTASSHGG